MNKYNILAESRNMLNDISLDESTGIQTMIDNMSRSSNVVIPTIVQTDSLPAEVKDVTVITPIYDELPGIKATVIVPSKTEIKTETKEVKNNSLSDKINNLDDKTKGKIIFGLLGLSIVLLVIAILK